MNAKLTGLIQAAKKGDANAQYDLGEKYQGNRGLPKDLTMSVYWYTKAAEQGHVLAQDSLGWAYQVGWGDLSVDIEQSQYWYAKSTNSLITAANQGDTRAQYRLFKKYELGLGVSEDFEEAKKWLISAVNLGYPPALCCYGDYSGGHPLFPKSAETAVRMFSAAAAKGDAYGQYRLARCYADGNGVGRDIERAISLYTQAAENDIGEAQYELGRIYANRMGVTKDLALARHWISLAAEQGHGNANKALAKLDAGATSIDGCYVATCVYGSHDCPEVLTLRRYRDDRLSKSWFGRCFIRIYYAVSPRIVEILGDKRWFYRLCRPVLDSIVGKLQKTSSVEEL